MRPRYFSKSPLRLLLVAGLAGIVPAVALAQPTTTRISVGPGGAQGNHDSTGGVISADGRWVAFASFASDLVPGDTNGEQDIFLHDLQAGVTTRVSVGTGGVQANFSSYDHAISADGRFVAFYSIASNLVPGDTNDEGDIFVHDRDTGVTTRVSVATGGGQGNLSSFSPAISADGRWVAFHSDAAFVPGDTNDTADVFVHDRQTGATTRVSVGSRGAQANAPSVAPAISGDGRWVAFQSFASNFVPGDTNGLDDVFVHDRQTETTTRVSVGSHGAQAGGFPGEGSSAPTISFDGRWVAFRSAARTLVMFDDTNGVADAFVHDRETGATTRVSVGSGGTEANGATSNASISPDGRWVAFQSVATNLVTGDTNSASDVFLHDRHTGTTTRVSVGLSGTQGNADSSGGAVSTGGRRVAFASSANNLVADDTNGRLDAFVHDRADASCVFALAPTMTQVLAAGGSGQVLVAGPADCGWTAVSNDPAWLSVTAGGGMGFGAFEFSAAANAGSSRWGGIAVDGQAFTVDQLDAATPLAPAALFVHTVVGNRVTLYWTMPPGGPPPTGFVLEGGVQPGEVLVSVPTGNAAPAFSFDAPAGSYYARVHALNGATRSAASNEIQLHVGPAREPSPPAHLVSLVNGSNVALSWTNTYEGGEPASVILQLFGTTGATIPVGQTDHVSFDGVGAGTYRIAVRAVNAAGTSQWSNFLTLFIPAPCSGPPRTPIDARSYSEGRTAFVSWTPDPAGPAPTTYVLIVTGSTVGAVVTDERELSGAVAPGTYAVSVFALNPCGISHGTAPQELVVR